MTVPEPSVLRDFLLVDLGNTIYFKGMGLFDFMIWMFGRSRSLHDRLFQHILGCCP